MHRWRGSVSLLLVVFTAAGCGSAATAPDVVAAVSPVAPTAELQQRLDALVAAGAPAAVIEVTDGDRRWSVAAGRVSRPGGRPAAVADPVRVDSVTTAMIATIVLQLVDERQLTLGTSVDDVLPGLLSRPVTIRQLLEHTSGLPDYVPQLAPSTVSGIVANADVVRSDSELIATAQSAPWTQVPGVSFAYSNTDYVVLGEIIRAIDGTTIGESLERRIFGPAGMTSSTYPVDSSMPDNALRGYLVDRGRYTDVTDFTPSFWGASAAVVSTVGDVNRFFRALFAGRLLPPAVVSQMQVSPEVGYGLGVIPGNDSCQTGSGGLVFGQRGNGFGYQTIAYSSRDGRRQVSLAWTASMPNPLVDPTDAPATAAVDAALAATCPPG